MVILGAAVIRGEAGPEMEFQPLQNTSRPISGSVSHKTGLTAFKDCSKAEWPLLKGDCQ